jgi:hypothetical protein
MKKLTRYLSIFSLSMLTACAPISVLYRSDPPGAIISGPRHGGGTFSLPTPSTIIYPDLDSNFVGQRMDCRTISSPNAQWPDGSYVSSQKLSICSRNSFYTFQKPIEVYRARPVQPQSLQPQPTPRESVDRPQTGKSIIENKPNRSAEQRCLSIGLKAGTLDFNNCLKSLSN